MLALSRAAVLKWPRPAALKSHPEEALREGLAESFPALRQDPVSDCRLHRYFKFFPSLQARTSFWLETGLVNCAFSGSCSYRDDTFPWFQVMSVTLVQGLTWGILGFVSPRELDFWLLVLVPRSALWVSPGVSPNLLLGLYCFWKERSLLLYFSLNCCHHLYSSTLSFPFPAHLYIQEPSRF